jgi:hypothetical protein
MNSRKAIRSIFSACSTLAAVLALLITPALLAQTVDPLAPFMRPFSRLAFGANIGTLGIGAEVATPLANRLNIRGGANFLTYGRNIDSDGLIYVATLDLRSGQASLDWFPFGGFHLSPGVIFYNGNRVVASVRAPDSTSFTLSSASYYSDPSDPLTGSANVTFAKVRPQFTIGFGNMIPRKTNRHLSVPVELGRFQ